MNIKVPYTRMQFSTWVIRIRDNVTIVNAFKEIFQTIATAKGCRWIKNVKFFPDQAPLLEYTKTIGVKRGTYTKSNL